MYEVVDYRICDCGLEYCPGEKESVLFQHKRIEECRHFMMLETTKKNVTKIFHYNDTKDKIDIYFLFGSREGRKKLRVQEVK